MTPSPPRTPTLARKTGVALGSTSEELYTLSNVVMALNSPLASVHVELNKSRAELSALGELDEEWDGDDATPIDREAIALAKSVVTATALYIERKGFGWIQPTVAPTPEGGVSVTWHPLGSIHWLLFRPQNEDVIYVHKERNLRPQRYVLSPENAARAIVLALSNQ